MYTLSYEIPNSVNFHSSNIHKYILSYNFYFNCFLYKYQFINILKIIPLPLKGLDFDNDLKSFLMFFLIDERAYTPNCTFFLPPIKMIVLLGHHIYMKLKYSIQQVIFTYSYTFTSFTYGVILSL